MKSLITFSFLILCVQMFISCENDIEKVNFYTGKKNIPIESMYDAEILYSDSGIVSGRLKAKKLDHYAGKRAYTVMPKGIVLEFFDHDLKTETKLTSNYAMKYDDRDLMEAKGNVVITNIKGETLNTEHIVWNQKTEQITSDAFVKIKTEKEILMGDGLISNQEFTKYKITKLRGIISLKDSIN